MKILLKSSRLKEYENHHINGKSIIWNDALVNIKTVKVKNDKKYFRLKNKHKYKMNKDITGYV